jgi:hypothetical protein
MRYHEKREIGRKTVSFHIFTIEYYKALVLNGII